jgi:hypothetical protein
MKQGHAQREYANVLTYNGKDRLTSWQFCEENRSASVSSTVRQSLMNPFQVSNDQSLTGEHKNV